MVGVTRNSLALVELLRAEGADVTVVETRDTRAAVLPEPETIDVVFVDPYVGLNARDPWLDRVRAAGVPVSSHADVVVGRARATTLGVTGTAGKTTTTALAAHLLRAAGRTVHVAADPLPETNLWPNYELLERLDEIGADDVLLAELTSNYLEFMTVSPDVAVVTNLWPDHEPDHGSFEAYVEAKLTILRHQTADAVALLNGDDEAVLRHFAAECRGRVALFGRVDHGESSFVLLEEGRIVARLGGERVPLGTIDQHDPFAGNVLGACAAAVVAGAPPEAVAAALPAFAGVPFRRRLVAEVGGVHAYNDAMAATPVKARVGLGTYPGPVVWIAGGRVRFPGEVLHDSDTARGQLAELALAARDRVRAAVLFGEAAAELRDVLAAAAFDGLVEEEADLAAAARRGAELARPGDSLVLAPVYSLPLEARAAFDELVVAALRSRFR